MIMTILLYISLLFAQLDVQLQIDPPNPSMEDEIQLSVSVSGNSDISAEDLHIKGIEAFKAYGGSSSSSISIINGRTQVQKEFGFTLIPKRPGVFQIGPVVIDGETYGSQIEVKIAENANTQSSSAPETQRNDDLPFYVEAVIDQDKKNPYVWEQVKLIFRFWRKTQVLEANMGDVKFDGFIHEKLPQNLAQREAQKVIDGVPWIVAELYFPLFPTQAGKITINPIELQLKAAVVSNAPRNRNAQGRRNPRSMLESFFGDDPFGRVTQAKLFRLKTKAIELNVRPLPMPTPENFSGAVGSMTANMQLSNKSLKVGESATLTMTLRGNAHMPGIQPPNLDWNQSMKGHFKIYDDKPSLTPSYDNQYYGGVKVFKWAIVPTKEFSGKIPDLTFHYFDPVAGKYKQVNFPIENFTVMPGDPNAASNLIVSPKSSPELIARNIKEVGDDLMPLIQTYSPNLPITMDQLIVLFCLLNSIFVLIYLMNILRTKKMGELNSDPKKILKLKAYKQFSQNWNQESKKYDLSTKEQQALIMSKLLRQYLGDKLGFDGPACTPLEIKMHLQGTKLPPELQTKLIDLLKSCDLIQYAQGQISQSEQLNFKHLNKMVKQCEQYLH